MREVENLREKIDKNTKLKELIKASDRFSLAQVGERPGCDWQESYFVYKKDLKELRRLEKVLKEILGKS